MKINLTESFWKGYASYLKKEKKLQLDLDEEESVNDVQDMVKGFLEYCGVTLGKNKSTTEDVEIEIPELLTLTVSYRDGADGGNFGVGATVGSGIKTLIKDDAVTSELDDDDDDNE